MNDDTFSRNEEWMVQFHRSIDRQASREPASGFANIVGARLANDELNASQIVFRAQLRSACDASQITDAIHAMRINDILVSLACEQQRNALRIAELERELADLRAAQQLADPTGAHPYRSPAKAPGSPVVTSDAPERVEGCPGALRRVYGALRRVCAAMPGLAVPLSAFAVSVATAPSHLSFAERTIGSAVVAVIAGAVVASEHGT